MSDTYTLLAEHIDKPDFIKAVLSGPLADAPWKKITIRRIMLQRGPALQIVRLDDRQADTKTVELRDRFLADALVQETLGLAYRHLTIQTSSALVDARVTKKGKLLQSTKSTVSPTATSTATSAATFDRVGDSEINVGQDEIDRHAHDRQKNRLVKEDAPFLDALGLATGGKVNPTGQRKFKQINEFIRALIGIVGFGNVLREEPIRIVDFGCGSAYLTFATYHYLHETLGHQCEVVGIDRNGPLLERASERAKALGWAGLTFRDGTIADVVLDSPPHVVVALHACDTATDDVLYRVAEWQTPVALVAPCCHNDVQRQLKAATVPQHFVSMIRKGMLKERLGDVLTDSLRCDILGLVGYQSEVIEFVSLEHTAKNLMIRSQRTGRPPTKEQIDQYVSLRDQWHVTPRLQTLLAGQLHGIIPDPTTN